MHDEELKESASQYVANNVNFVILLKSIVTKVAKRLEYKARTKLHVFLHMCPLVTNLYSCYVS